MKIQKSNDITIWQSPNRREQPDKAYGFSCKYHIPSGDTKQLEKAVTWDNCIAEYKNGHRKTDHFFQADCLLADIDNTHSEKEADWITPEDVENALPDVPFYYYPSKNHRKPKKGQAPRPKYHLIFPTHILETASEYSDYAKKLVSMFPQLHFDSAVTGAAQLNFGVENPVVRYVDGKINLTEYILSNKQETFQQTPDTKPKDTAVIPQGQRNNTLHKFALSVLTKYGETDTVYNLYLKESQKCSPLLTEKEVQSIWNAAVNYYNGTIKVQSDYIEPSIYQKASSATQWEIPPVNPVAVQQLYSIDKRDRKFSITVTRLILDAIGVTIKFNDMNRRTEINGIPEKYGKDDLNNLLATFVYDIAYKLSFKKVTSKIAYENLHVIAIENHYHPVITLLHERSWDNADRLPLIYEILGITDKNYQSLIKKWAIQTIAVLFNSDDTPVTAEGVLVLQGKQGIGKTQFFRHLAIKDSFFKGGATLDMTNKDSLMSATKVWICELGEIDSTTKKEQSALKAFLTEQTDRYREPYARCETVRPRRTSFCGTVNPQDYLRDETGNRRFWTIPIEKIDLKRIFELSPEWYVQFWRQILTIYKSNPKEYLLTEKEKNFINCNNQQYEQLLFGEDEFLTCADFQADKALWKWQTAAEIAKVLNEEFRSLHISSARIGKLLNRIEERQHIMFERKTVKGKRLILCPPIANTTANNTYQISDLPDYKLPSLQILSDEEPIIF
ncbi:VapE domain-containing protein [Lachnospiraceae bacterium 42-17]|jgi:hypothetical protein